MCQGLPEGFFDDPDIDAKMRGMEAWQTAGLESQGTPRHAKAYLAAQPPDTPFVPLSSANALFQANVLFFRCARRLPRKQKGSWRRA